jgi:hypothetical protein
MPEYPLRTLAFAAERAQAALTLADDELAKDFRDRLVDTAERLLAAVALDALRRSTGQRAWGEPRQGVN